MKVLIFADMEGITGIVKVKETNTGDAWWERSRAMMTDEVNAAVEGALQAGATQVDVLDWHNGGINILPDKLHPDANLIRGAGAVIALTACISHKSYDSAIILGMHAKHGSRGVIAHTMDGLSETEFNGKLVGETELIAAFCGHFDIPVALVSGDKAATEEALAAMPGIITVATKEGIAFSAARCFSPVFIHSQLKARTKLALGRGAKPVLYKQEYPLDVKMHLAAMWQHPLVTDLLSFIPTVTKVDEKTISFRCADMPAYFKLLTVISHITSPYYKF